MTRRALVRELDHYARRVTLERAGERCERCGSACRLQWHHVYSRAIRSLRWDLDNLLILCAGCHLWWHHNPLDAVGWFRAYCSGTDPKRLVRLDLAKRTRTKQDLGVLLVYLRALVGRASGA